MSDLNSFESIAIYTVLGVAILGLAYAIFLRQQILREDKGTAKMQEVWGWIKDGANAYLSKQLRSILPLIAVLTVALFLSSFTTFQRFFYKIYCFFNQCFIHQYVVF